MSIKERPSSWQLGVSDNSERWIHNALAFTVANQDVDQGVSGCVRYVKVVGCGTGCDGMRRLALGMRM